MPACTRASSITTAQDFIAPRADFMSARAVQSGLSRPSGESGASNQPLIDASPAHQAEADRLRAKLRAAPSPTPNTAPAKSHPNTKVDAFHVSRGTYLLRYADGSGLQRGALPYGPTEHKTGATYVGSEQIASTPVGFVLDSALAGVLAPIGALFTVKAVKDAFHHFKRRKTFKAQQQAVAQQQAETADPAQRAVLSMHEHKLKRAASLSLNNGLESTFAGLDRGTYVGNLIGSIIAKIGAVAHGKSITHLALEAGTVGISLAGAVCSLVLGPLGGIFQLGEAIFMRRRSAKMERQFKEAAYDALSHARIFATTPGLREYGKFVEHKHDVREKFYRHFRRWTKLRVATASLLGATAAVKFGVSIAAFAAGIALSSPVGWALTAGLAVVATLGMIGASTFIYDRRRSRYESYTRRDDPLINRPLLQQLDATDPQSSLAQRARVYDTLSQQRASLQGLTKHLQRQYRKTELAWPLDLVSKARAGFLASACAAQRLLTSGGQFSEARRVFDLVWMGENAGLTRQHFRYEVANGSQAWRAYMRQHLAAEGRLLKQKIALEKASNEDTSTTQERLQKVQAVSALLDQPTPNQVFDIEPVPNTETNRAFLALLPNHKGKRALSDSAVTRKLAQSMKSHQARHLRDLSGILFDCELDAARIRQRAAA